jgi:hypothetical protein
MESISIRRLRGAHLQASARQGKLLAITDHRVLIGVAVPVASAWVEHLIDYNWSRVVQSIAEGEQAAADPAALVTLDEAVLPDDEAAAAQAGRLALPLAAAVTGAVTRDAASQEVIGRLREALSPPQPAADNGHPPDPPVRTVRIGDLSAHLILEAGEAGQTLAVTHERELVAIVIPVTINLVEFLIEQNMSRVLYNIGLAEKQLSTGEKFAPLDQVTDPPASPADGPDAAG